MKGEDQRRNLDSGESNWCVWNLITDEGSVGHGILYLMCIPHISVRNLDSCMRCADYVLFVRQ